MDASLIDRQVMVITGASSGIGLATAGAAARAGAKLMLAARSAQALQEIVRRPNAQGSRAVAVTCDVAQRDQVEALRRMTISAFGRVDRWVNNSGVSIYELLEDVSQADSRRLFDTNLWGVITDRWLRCRISKQTAGRAEAMVMRIQLAHSNQRLRTPVFTMHSITMIFWYARPILSGFSIYLIPLVIGARDSIPQYPAG